MIGNRQIVTAREIPFETALEKIGATYKADRAFRPRKNPATRLLLIEISKNHYELKITEPKFLLRRRGECNWFAAGGGAIDLVIALTGCQFRAAVHRLLSAPAEKVAGNAGRETT